MDVGCLGISALDKGPKIMWGLCPRHQGCYFVGESYEESTMEEVVMSTLGLITRIWSRHWRRSSGEYRFRWVKKRSIRIFEKIIGIKERFNLEFSIKIIGGNKFGDIDESDANKGSEWLVEVEKKGGVLACHGEERHPDLEKEEEGGKSF